MFQIIKFNPATQEHTFDMPRWGFIPAQNKDPKDGRKPINAMNVTVDTNGMFRAAFKARRCLVPVTGLMVVGPHLAPIRGQVAPELPLKQHRAGVGERSRYPATPATAAGASCGL